MSSYRDRRSPLSLRAGRARRTRPWIVAVLVAVALCLPQGAQQAANAAGTCALTPQLRDFTVNQGVGNYAVLTRGKETEVRLFLSKPSCATNGQGIGLTSATLTMNIPGSPSKTYTTLNPVSIGSPAPLSSYSSAAAPDAAGDPKFVIPGPDLVSSDPSTRFIATFTATITVGATTTPVTFSAISGGGAAMTATVEQRTKALRILVVPMGGALSDVDSSTLQAGLNNLSRMLPVPKAGGQLTGPLTSTSSVGGIRYAINAGVATVPLNGAGRFCGNLNNFDAIKAQLAQYRNDWNAANSANTTDPDKNPTADIVLGVVSSATSLSGNDGCAEGMASTSSPEAWVRLVPAASTPSTAGNLMAMEIAHTFGAEARGPSTNPWADPLNPTHSKNTEADAGTNRAYNITTRSFLSDDRTAMKSQTAGWNQDTTVYEKRDYEFLTCRLGGRPNADCLTTGTVGTINGVGAGPTFLMSGTTDNTAAGTHIVEAFGGPPAAFTTPPTSSRYTLQFLRGTTVVSQVLVAADFGDSEHVPNQPADRTSLIGLITVAVPFPLNATPHDVRLIYRPPTGGTRVLFSSTQNGQPTLDQLSVSNSAGGSESSAFVNYTNTELVDEQDPALSFDGKWIAWTTTDGLLHVASTSDSDLNDTFETELGTAMHPTWRPDDSEIAFAVSNGDINTVSVDTSGTGPVFGFESPLYDHANFSSRPADNPSYSPDGSTIAFDAPDYADVSQIFTMPSDGPGSPEQITDGETDAADPSWSQTPGDDQIAFVTTDEISAIRADGLGYPTPLTYGSEPSWGSDGTLAYNADGTIATVETGPLLDPSPPTDPPPPVEPPAIDGQKEGYGASYPTYIRRGISGFVGELPVDPPATQTDIFLEQSTAAGVSVTAAGGIVGGNTNEASLNNLRLTLYYQCPGSPERSVLGLALEPTSFTGVGTPDAHALFDQTFDDSQLCGGSGGGTVTGVLSDFFTTAPFPGQPGFNSTFQSRDVSNSAQGPVAAIVDPVQDATFFDWQTIALQGEGTDGRLQQVPDLYLSWNVNGQTSLGSTVDHTPLPAGDYPVSLTVTDPGTGLTDVATTTIHVVADFDHDGLSDDLESHGCFAGTDAITNGDSINLDSDGDGIPDGQDPSPCVASTASYQPTVTFSPTTLNLPSQGNFVTMTVKQNAGTPNLMTLVPGSVRLVSIRGIRLTGTTATTIDVSGEALSANTGWTVTGTTGKDQTGTAKFDRQLLNTYLKSTFKMNQTLTLTLSGYSSVPAWALRGSGATTIKKGDK